MGFLRWIYPELAVVVFIASLFGFVGGVVNGFSALIVLGVAHMTTVPPAFAFTQAHRGRQILWVLVPLVLIVLPRNLYPALAVAYFVAWKMLSSRAVYRAWVNRDPQGYQNYLDARRRAAILRVWQQRRDSAL
jgi:magnesium-transporting ATPase (P-type)